MEKILLGGYDDFNTYAAVGTFRATTSFRYSDVQRRVITSEASRVVSRLSCNNKSYNTIINPMCTIFTLILQTIIVTNRTTTVSHDSNIFCTKRSESLVFGYDPKLL